MRLLFEQERRVMPEYDGKGKKNSFRKGGGQELLSKLQERQGGEPARPMPMMRL